LQKLEIKKNLHTYRKTLEKCYYTHTHTHTHARNIYVYITESIINNINNYSNTNNIDRNYSHTKDNRETKTIRYISDGNWKRKRREKWREISQRDEKKALLSAASADMEERKGWDYRVDWKWKSSAPNGR